MDTQKDSTSFLDAFGLKYSSKRVLLDVIRHGISTAADIAARLNMPKPSVYDAIDSLVEKSLVNEYSDERGKAFGVSDPEQLSRAHKEKMVELQSAQSSLVHFIKHHGRDDSVARPKIKFYSGTLGIRQAFRDMPWTSEFPEAYLMWPMKDMMESLDEKFLKWHGEQRLQYKVLIKVIQRETDRSLQSKEHEWLEDNVKTKFRHVKYLPKKYDWKMSYWIYGDKCLFASGGAEQFAFTIHSKEFCHVMKLLWANMWEKALD